MTRRPVRRPYAKGVSAEERRGVHGPLFVGRYTSPAGKRRSIGSRVSWQEAFTAAKAEQDRIARAGYCYPRSSDMTFGQLVTEHFLPTYGHASPITRKNLPSHLRNGTGKPTRMGAKNIRAPRYPLLHVFEGFEIAAISRQQVRTWQAAMIRENYDRSSILAKRRSAEEHPRNRAAQRLDRPQPGRRRPGPPSARPRRRAG